MCVRSKIPDFIEPSDLCQTLTNYERNGFVQFLVGLFPNDPDDIWQALHDYLIGTTKQGDTIFWQIDRKRRIRTGKTIKYDSDTGKRRKDMNPNWIHAEMKKAGLLKTDFNLQQCFFGEHLLSLFPNRPVAFVESEKSAVLGSICKGLFPEIVWLACGGKSNLTVERLEMFGRIRIIILYPDADGFERWQSIAVEARRRGLKVVVSDLIEKNATEAEKAEGYDLADYLIRLQRQRIDPAIQEAFRDLIEERLSIMTFDGRLELDQAEAEITANGFYHGSIRTVLEFS